MIGYVNLGTNDLARAAVIYDAIATVLGIGPTMEWESCIGWEPGPHGGAGRYVTRPFDKNPATVGNGVIAALSARDTAQVDQLHKVALDKGGAD